MKLSIIIPVYNVRDYIARCVASIGRQTLTDYEVLLVDDLGSDDSIAVALASAAEWGIADRVRVVRMTQNGGPGAARNLGIEHAQGDYVAMVDSDDAIEPNMFQFLLSEAERQGGTDLCCCMAQCIDEQDAPGRVLTNPRVSGGRFSDVDKCRYLAQFKSYIWTYIYRRAFLVANHLQFPPLRSSEDSVFLIQTLLSARTIAQVDRPLYHYRVRAQSLTTRRDSQRYRIKMQAFEWLHQQLRSTQLARSYAHELAFIYLKKAYLVSCLNYLNDAEQPQVGELDQLKQDLDRLAPHWSTNPYYRSNWTLQILVTLLQRVPRLSVRLLPWILKHTKIAL